MADLADLMLVLRDANEKAEAYAASLDAANEEASVIAREMFLNALRRFHETLSTWLGP